MSVTGSQKFPSVHTTNRPPPNTGAGDSLAGVFPGPRDLVQGEGTMTPSSQTGKRTAGPGWDVAV